MVRLHAMASPGEPLFVHDGYVHGGEGPGFGRGMGAESELRGWIMPGLYPALRIGARDFRERLLEGVEVRHDGPTILDVLLEPL